MNKFPTVDYVIHTTDKIAKLGPVKFRTFTVGEHRQFLEAQQLGDANAIFDTLLAMLEACTFGKIPVRKTEMYILDALYLEIFIKSKGATVPATYRCTHLVPGENEMVECGTRVTVNIPLQNAALHFPEGYVESEVIKTGENAGIKLRQPVPDEYLKIRQTQSAVDITDQFLYSSIECVFDGDRVMYPGVDYDLPGLIAYVESLPDTVVSQIQKFYDQTPTLQLDLQIKCPKCGHEENIHLEGLDDFFV